MIRFLNLKNQICEGQNDFAFYDTVSDSICCFGPNMQEVFSSIEEFEHEFGEHIPLSTKPIGRFLNLIPENYFDK